MARRTIIIGDVHGCVTELKALVEAVEPSHEDRLVFVGDLVDKGPRSAEVVRFVRELRDKGFAVVLVEGNHEEKHRRFRTALARGGEKAVKKFKNRDELSAITEALSDEDIAFLDSAVPFARLPEHDAVVVHGGILPVWEELDANDKSIVSRLMRVRHVTSKAVGTVTFDFTLEGDFDLDSMPPEQVAEFAKSASEVRRKVRPAGSFISLGNETKDDPFWAEIYGADARGPRFGHVFFGHEPFKDSDTPVLFPHATGLDLGCVLGNKLAAVILEEGKPQESVTVDALAVYATGLWEE